MVKSAIFDADGTLLDSMQIWEDAGEKYLRQLGIQPEADLGKLLYPMSLEESSSYMKEKYSLSETPEEIRAGVLSVIFDFYRYDVQLKPGVKDFLEQLQNKNIPMVIATTGDKDLLEAALKRLGILDCFERIFTCSEFLTTKRESLIYEKAITYLHIEPEETYVFEDVLNALVSAKKAGCKTIAIEEETSKEDKEAIIETADMYLTSFIEYEDFWEFAAK